MLGQRLITKYIALGVSLLLSLTMLAGCGQVQSQTSANNPASSDQSTPSQVTIKDMSGREVTIPSNVKSILALHPIPTYLLYRLAPDKVLSKDTVFASRYLTKDSVMVYSEGDRAKLSQLPTTGVYFKGLSTEQLLQLNPQMIISLTKDPKLDDLSNSLKIPVIAVSKDSMADYEASMRLIGKIVGNTSEAEKLADYWHKTIDEVQGKVAQIPSDKQVKVFFAGANGILTTPGTKTIMASIVKTAGGLDVAQGLSGDQTNESISVSQEQVLQWNPDVIIVGTQRFKDQILANPAWATLNAVKNNKVFVQPRYASLDGITALMGLVWLEGKLYSGDQNSEPYFTSKMQEFYTLFHNYKITPEQVNEVSK